MNGNTDFDRIAQSWLQDGPTEMPDRSIQAALDEVHVTSQQRFGAARRTFNMNGNAFRLAAAAAVALFIIVAGGIYLGNNNQSGGVAVHRRRPPHRPPRQARRPARRRHSYRPIARSSRAGTARCRSAWWRDRSLPPCRSRCRPAGRPSNPASSTRTTARARGRPSGCGRSATDSSNPAPTTRSSRQPPDRASTSCSLPSPASPGSSRPEDGCDGRWIQRQVRRADRRHQYRHLPRRQRGRSSVRLLAVGLGRRRSPIRPGLRRDGPDLCGRRRAAAGSPSLPGIPERTTAADRAELQAIIDSITIEPAE